MKNMAVIQKLEIELGNKKQNLNEALDTLEQFVFIKTFILNIV